MFISPPDGTGGLKRVREIMVPLEAYPRIGIDQSLREAVAVIEKVELEVGLRRSLPRVILVFDGERDLVGLVRRRDIMRGLEPNFLVSQPMEYQKKAFDVAVDPNLAVFSYDRILKGVRDQADRPVRDVLQPIKVTIEADDHLMKAVQEMVNNNLAMIPVVEIGEVVGVLRSVDLFHELAQLLD